MSVRSHRVREDMRGKVKEKNQKGALQLNPLQEVRGGSFFNIGGFAYTHLLLLRLVRSSRHVM